MAKEIVTPPEDIKALQSYIESPHTHLEEIAAIIAKTLGIEGSPEHVIVTTEHPMQGKRTGVNRSYGVKSWKCCAQYSNGTCGCVVNPPGISRMCTASERRTT
jgi:hypothetical protein